MAKLTLLRHGISYTNSKLHKTAKNEANFLTVNGFKGALESGEEFKQEGIKFDYACCSTYPRTFLTAAAFLSGAEHAPIEVEQFPEIVERQYGFKEYMPTSVLEQMYGGEEIQGWDDLLDTCPGDPSIGETQQQVYDRVVEFFNTKIIPRLAQGQNVLMVTHFYVMRALISHIDHGSAAGMPNIHVSNADPVTYDFLTSFTQAS